ncbi:MAG TPA: hypothetical protein DDZ41_12085 [Flavobacterium sp.]|nr:hypothetical protein [Flavobacterium sp.]
MIVIVFKYSMPTWVRGIAFFPFIFVSNKMDSKNNILLNHEKIHLRQQLELAILLFYVWYLFEFVIRFIRLGNVKQAYTNISFEREAYQNEQNLSYLKKRPLFKFLGYT